MLSTYVKGDHGVCYTTGQFRFSHIVTAAADDAQEASEEEEANLAQAISDEEEEEEEDESDDEANLAQASEVESSVQYDSDEWEQRYVDHPEERPAAE